MKHCLAPAVAVLLLLSTAETASQLLPGSPMRIVVLVDSSAPVSSMLNQFRAALRILVDALPTDAEAAILSTGGQLRIRVPPTADRERLRAAAGGFSSDGGANSLLDAMLEADRRFLKTARDRRSVFVIITTDDAVPRRDVRADLYNDFLRDFVERGGRAHAIVIAGLNRGRTSEIAENLTQNTGGFHEVVAIANALPKLVETLAAHVAVDQ